MPEGGVRTSLSNFIAALTAPFQMAAAAARAPRSTAAQQNQNAAIQPNYSYGPSNLGTGDRMGPRNIYQFDQTFQPADGMFGPGFPLIPSQRERIRRWDYDILWNTIYTPRSFEAIGFEELRQLARYDLVRLCIETRKDQVDGLGWKFNPVDPHGANQDAAIEKMTEFWQYPDGRTHFHQWLRQALEEVMVTDAPAFEVRSNRAGEIIGFDIIDGATIKVLLDETGRRPTPPAPAYEQIIHGRPWALTQDGSRIELGEGEVVAEFNDGELIYLPRNPRIYKGYGFSAVEQIYTTINIGLRRQTKQLQHFTVGNIPVGLINTPEGWSADQMREYQEWMDTYLSGNTGNQTKIIWGPAGATYQEFSPPPLKDEFDEWLSRIVSFVFSLPPTWAVRQVNRATAETSQDTSLEEGKLPLLNWCKRLIDFCTQKRLGYPGIEFNWVDIKPVDAEVQSKVHDVAIKNGSMTINEARDQLGFDPIEGGNNAIIVTASGPVLLSDIEAISGRAANPPAPPPMLGGDGTHGGPPEEGSEGATSPRGGRDGGQRPGSSRGDQAVPKDEQKPAAKGSDLEHLLTALLAQKTTIPDKPPEDEEGRAAKRSDPFSLGAPPHWLASIQARISREVADFLNQEAARVAHELASTFKSVADHTDPDQQGVTPADSHTKRRVLAAVAAALAGINLSRWAELGKGLAPELEAAAAQAAEETLRSVGTAVTPALAAEVREWARLWARDRAAELVGMRWVGGRAIPVSDAEHSLAASSLKMIAGTVRDAIAAGSTADELAAILGGAAAFSPERAKRIAAFETRNLAHAATMWAFKRSGRVKGSYWVTMGDDAVEEICLENEAASPVRLGHPFPSGHLHPMAHNQCRCWLVPWFGEETGKIAKFNPYHDPRTGELLLK